VIGEKRGRTGSRYIYYGERQEFEKNFLMQSSLSEGLMVKEEISKGNQGCRFYLVDVGGKRKRIITLGRLSRGGAESQRAKQLALKGTIGKKWRTSGGNWNEELSERTFSNFKTRRIL